MILQALTRHYEDLLSRGEIAGPGWAPAKISYALCLDGEGHLIQVVPLMTEVTRGKKTVLQPQMITLPAAVKRTVGVEANFLWDNSAYLLGVDQKGKPERSRECVAAAALRHHAVLDGVDSPVARAILAFFDTWQPEHAAEHPALAEQWAAVTAGGNLLFRADARFPQEDEAIREAWQRFRGQAGPDAVRMQCLVTGREEEIPATHPAIKGGAGCPVQRRGTGVVQCTGLLLLWPRAKLQRPGGGIRRVCLHRRPQPSAGRREQCAAHRRHHRGLLGRGGGPGLSGLCHSGLFRGGHRSVGQRSPLSPPASGRGAPLRRSGHRPGPALLHPGPGAQRGPSVGPFFFCGTALAA